MFRCKNGTYWKVTKLCAIDERITSVAADDKGHVFWSSQPGLFVFDQNHPSEPVRKCVVSESQTYGMREIVWNGNDKIYSCNQKSYNITAYDISSGNVNVITGTGKKALMDGKLHEATYSYLWGVFVDKNGDIFITDEKTIRKINLRDQTVQTIIAITGDKVDLAGITVREDGSMYVCDWGSNVIRVVENGIVTTLEEPASTVPLAERMSPFGILDYQGTLLVTAWTIGGWTARYVDTVKRTTYKLDFLDSIQPRCLAQDKDGNIFIGGTKGGIYRMKNPWILEKFLWLAHMKEDASSCPLACLPKDIIRVIAEFIYLV